MPRPHLIAGPVVLAGALALVAGCGSDSTPAAPAAEAPAADAPAAEAPAADAPAADAAAMPLAERLTVADARVRAMPPGSPATGAFMTFTLDRGPAGAVVGGESPAAERVELHTHTKAEDGTMQMREVPRFDLSPDGPTVLEPGGLHVMLIGLQQELVVGEEIPLTLRLDDGSTTTLQVPVARVQPPAGMAGAHGGADADPDADEGM